MFKFFFVFLLTACFLQAGESTVQFTPPQGWRLAETDKLPKSVLLMAVGQGENEMPPSIYLTVEDYRGTLKEYMEIVRQINAAKGNEWKDLGVIKTQAGNASFSQADIASEWGQVRMMHAILIDNGIVYNLTAAALKSEFPKFYKDFFKTLRSLEIKT